jgi:hypothetical protein
MAEGLNAQFGVGQNDEGRKSARGTGVANKFAKKGGLGEMLKAKSSKLNLDIP